MTWCQAKSARGTPLNSWYAANSERARENGRRWRAANPEYQRRWRVTNPERVREYQRLRYAANPEKWREWVNRWRAANPENVRGWVRKRLALKRGSAHVRYTETDLDLIYRLQDGMCLYCEKKIERRCSKVGTHLDHMAPLSRGGSDAAANVAFACATCNLKKHNSTAEEFLRQL